MPSIFEEKLWMGTETSLQATLDAVEAQAKLLAAGTVVGGQKEDQVPRLVEIDGDIAHINISGPLVNDGDSDWNEYFGMTGYPEIREAMVYAATKPEVKHILLNIESGGGAVSGVADTGKLIRMIHDKVKPVTAYTDGAMYSAAYWLGSSAGDVYAGKAAGVGSIGVIATHMERSEMLKEMGIGVTVVRAGKYKALANGVEKLSEEGKAQIQASVDSAYKIFVDHVATMRGKSYEFADSVMAQGREFFGQAAADAGLVDGIRSIDEVVSSIQEKLMDTSNPFMDNRGKQASGLRTEHTGEATMAKKTLTEHDVAALAAGAPLEASVPPAQEQENQPAQAAVEPAAPAAPAAPQAAVEPGVQEDASSGVALKLVTEQLNAAREDLMQARIAASKLEDKLNELNAVVEPLKDIAIKALNNMRVAMRGSAMDYSASSPAQILAEHTAVSASFMKQFPVGGVASVDAAAGTKEAPTSFHKARVKAAGFSHK